MNDENITITVPLSLVNLSLQALAELPAKVSMAAIQTLQRVTTEAIDAKNTPVPVPLDVRRQRVEPAPAPYVDSLDD